MKSRLPNQPAPPGAPTDHPNDTGSVAPRVRRPRRQSHTHSRTIKHHTNVARHEDTKGIMPGNGYVESFHARLCDELLDGEIFYSLREAEVLIERWRQHNCFASQHPSGYVVESGSVP